MVGEFPGLDRMIPKLFPDNDRHLQDETSISYNNNNGSDEPVLSKQNIIIIFH